MQKIISVHDFDIANDKPFVLIGGLNVLESKELALQTAEHFKKVCDRLQIPYIYKASFDKANRSSIDSFRGPGVEEGLRWLAEIKKECGVPIITDVHEPSQAAAVAEVADILQLPAFLSRQTDLVAAVAKTNAVINIKKAQFLAPEDMGNIVKKCEAAGNNKVMICERGTAFGYHNLVVDMLGFPVMKKIGCPIIFDVTHSLQLPGGLGHAAGGRREDTLALARSAMAQGLAGLFLEAHPNPDQAKCDGPSALPLDQLESFLSDIKRLDELVKTSEPQA